MYGAVLTMAWFAGTIYATIQLFALIVRPLKRFLNGHHLPLQVIIPSWFIMMAAIYFMTWPWREAVLYRVPLVWLAAVFLFGTAILIYQRSRLGFSRVRLADRNDRDRRPERPLVTSGLRQRIRHPIYLAHLCMLLAWTVGSGEVVLYGLAIFALLTGWPMIRQEEAELEDRFGEEYRAYKRAVPAALVPRVLSIRW
jgi:protein-S-isoprenylcysteine O-methyltransferase Ste14